MPYFKAIIQTTIVGSLFLCFTCTKPASKKVFKDGEDILYGEITRDDLFTEYPDWYDNYIEYKPDSTMIAALSAPHPDIKVDIFMGTWCSDSRREVPRFFKTVDESNFIEDDQIDLWAVDRNKSLGSDIIDKKNITRVATFIFYRKNEEVGRIIERPDHTNIEFDILSIVEGS